MVCFIIVHLQFYLFIYIINYIQHLQPVSTYLWIQIPVEEKRKKLSVYVINLNSVSL